MSEPTTRSRGRNVVITVYVAIVALTGVMGVLIGLVLEEDLEPVTVLAVELPPPAWLGLWGAIAIAGGLGLLLVAVHVVGKRYDDAKAPEE